MAALPLAANIISVLDLTGTCLKTCSKQVGPSAYSSEQLNQIRTILYGLNGTTRNLQTCIDINEEDEARLQSFQHLQEPLQRCDEALRLLSQRLQDQSTFTQYIMGARFDKKFEDCMRVLGQAKDLLDHALQCDQRTLISAAETYIRSVARETQDIRATLSQHEEILTHLQSGTDSLIEATARLEIGQDMDKQRQHKKEVLSWLSDSNPRDNFLDVMDTKEAGTGQWLLEHDHFKALESGSIHKLWLSGIPGSGKTYLITAAIDHIEKASEASVAFFYFDFRDSAKQSTITMLRSIACQLESGLQTDIVSNATKRLYQECQKQGFRRPTTEEGLELLTSLLNIRQSYIILDALDECEDRSLLAVLSKLSAEDNGAKVLVASRPKLEIARALEDANFSSIVAKGDDVKKDIELSINSALQSDSHLRRLPQLLKSEIRDTLMAKAGSMFRWVRCQLDALRPLKSSRAIKNSLAMLPRTLDETYERILQGVIDDGTEEILEMMKRLLAFIIFSKAPMTLEQLAQALVVDTAARTFDHDAAFLDPSDILSLCPSMLAVSSSTGLVGFVHYSVQEYLLSDRLATADGAIRTLALDSLAGHTLLAKVCLSFILYDEFAAPCTSNREMLIRDEQNPFWAYAANFWHCHVSVSDHVQFSNLDLLVHLLSMTASDSTLTSVIQAEKLISGWNRRRNIRCTRLNVAAPLPPFHMSSHRIEHTSDSTESALFSGFALAVELGLDDVVRELISKGADVEARWGGTLSPLTVAIMYEKLTTVQLLVGRGADVNADQGQPLLEAIRCESPGIVQYLLDIGAKVNKPFRSKLTPLQFAASQSDRILMFEILLRAGADVDVGNDAWQDDIPSLESPIGRAARHGTIDVVVSLISAGASLNGTSVAQLATALLAVRLRLFSWPVGRLRRGDYTSMQRAEKLANEICIKFRTCGYSLGVIKGAITRWPRNWPRYPVGWWLRNRELLAFEEKSRSIGC